MECKLANVYYRSSIPFVSDIIGNSNGLQFLVFLMVYNARGITTLIANYDVVQLTIALLRYHRHGADSKG